MQQLYRTLYQSRANGDVLGDPQSALTSILAISSRNNVRVGVTGALLYCAGVFLQVLEGPQCAVVELLKRVSRDGRHDNLRIILSEAVSTRSFAHWSMCGAVFSPLDREIVLTLEHNERFCIDRLEATDAIALLECVQRIQAKRKMQLDTHFIG